ncbi:methylase of polypeptide subunit release factors [Breznakia sp. PF5-3]|uniref:tRNA (mnm(5)s(2)U34)-methyltransferase n=1 Tax=unclassified Breznakia TaxID=2623764 RepID=UPI002406FA64|nr:MULTISPECIES: class I SAM-dependent methyltransferase [unclassified Breznakia]MDF9824220.1 methylase of polypeptide subunit release factors [Breznakia sp. PM6-1]MDF9835018.1 methylase of polypeptide subunit release factors [Breznakia sp. PF5-3]MDF9837263.1 methylase of polypeptide subunit release factors [Breznakia sp. PFB2-8]MDF9859253.1 methylase of polypeptide subunit release factors [Breznakia sp. PH5-24]
MKKVTEQAQELLLRSKNKQIAIDFTCGNGNDTFFLASAFKEVHAFDIQEMAIKNTQELCAQFTNVNLHLTSHSNFDNYVETFDAGIFNLGYLPHGDEKITTDAMVVIDTLEKCWKHLTDGGRIVLVLYPGFKYGKKEAEIIEKYCQSLASKHFDILKVQLLNRNHAPYILCIEKK